MVEPTSSNSNSSAVEPYWRTSVRFWVLPVLPTPWILAHWLELSPSWVAEKSWLSSPLSPSCSSSWLICAMAGIAATASIAKSAANSINFFIFYLPPSVTPGRDSSVPHVEQQPNPLKNVGPCLYASAVCVGEHNPKSSLPRALGWDASIHRTAERSSSRKPLSIRPHRYTVPERRQASLFTGLPRRVLLGNSRHEKSRGVREPRPSCLL